jgi:hypothetical protein
VNRGIDKEHKFIHKEIEETEKTITFINETLHTMPDANIIKMRKRYDKDMDQLGRAKTRNETRIEYIDVNISSLENYIIPQISSNLTKLADLANRLRDLREEYIEFGQTTDDLAKPLGNNKVGTLQSLAKESIITNPEIDHDGLPETVKTVMDQQTGGRRTRRQKRRSRRSRKQTI